MIKTILEDTFEKLVEQGTTQAKKAVKSTVNQVKQTISPTKMWEQLLGVSSDTTEQSGLAPRSPAQRDEVGKTSEVKRDGNHTPLNLEKLGKSYQDKEKQKTEVLKQRLFQLVKRGEEEILQANKQEEMEKKRKEAYEIEMKKRKEEEKKKQQAGEIPRGKVRRSIFSPKKAAQRQHAELKPASGKQ